MNQIMTQLHASLAERWRPEDVLDVALPLLQEIHGPVVVPARHVARPWRERRAWPGACRALWP